MSEADQERGGLDRRQAIAAVGAAGAGLFFTNGIGWFDAAGVPVQEDAVAATACTLSKELTEGPYWIANGLTRRDVTEDRVGVPLTLLFTVEAASTCQIIANADVEIWHADAQGAYSGVGRSGSSSRWLRGHQKTNSKGVARFDTIYPGWYMGRTPHIHLKVHVGGNVVHTGQMFFKDSITRAVYRTKYYKSRGQADTTNSQDNIYESGSLLALTKRPASSAYIGRKTLAVDTG